MSQGESIIRFEKVSFEYKHNKPLLEEVSFSLRRGSKTTIMGQNGAGKSTIFKLITGTLKPVSGNVHIAPRLTVAVSRQVISGDQLDMTVRDFFDSYAKPLDGQEKIWDIDPRIDELLEVVNLLLGRQAYTRIVRSFSGGQQARLLLASALIQNSDVLLLDEPTNNLDKAGIAHL